MKHYDAIVIGAGQAGSPLSKKLAGAGKKTALIEKKWIGGTCINDGCTPTKTMIASAKLAYLAARCNNLGVDIKGFKVNLKEIKKRKDKIVEHARNGSQEAIEKTKDLDLIFGEARFTDKKTITVKLNEGGEETFTADQFFIDTGTATVIPDIDGLQDSGYLTSTTILDLEKIPEHLVVIGGNYIGLEFAQMFKRFGSSVTILERGARIMAREDDDLAEEVREILLAEGIDILTGVKLQKIKKGQKGLTVKLIAGKDETQLKCSHILVAAGRAPQTRSLGLDKTGVEVDDKGYIKVNDKLETNVKGIYALGDVKGGPAFTHIAYNDYTIVYRNLIKGEDLNIKDRPVPYCMFIDPQLGRVGLTEKEAQEQGYDIKVAKLQMEHVARAVEVGETRGLMKAVVDAKTKEILGVAILGEEGGEIMSVMQMAMLGGITYDRIRYCVFAHPTYSESLNNLFMTLEE
ncbi:mercuric reductase [Mucilaginibacter ginkgonis]|uniref:Mercuric reductase n=1 Tax=Mucilaginibacter ginkgonis TaxID=2682091 RepID=A0A6I4I074_9SPHI|nr:mercuric reductase [Mucilaginibacter ginkgonis]QQL48991.1 mercuric reductase [Mucilaginibacter ginkgonis]